MALRRHWLFIACGVLLLVLIYLATRGEGFGGSQPGSLIQLNARGPQDMNLSGNGVGEPINEAWDEDDIHSKVY